MKKNFYEILQVQPGAHPAIIKTAYRTTMQELKMHPDLGGDSARAQELNEAYEVLSDPEKRLAYDRGLSPEPAGGAYARYFPGAKRTSRLRWVLALLAGAAAVLAIEYYGREKEPVWIGHEFAPPAARDAAVKK